ncbi:MAG: hypothetical protein P8R42_06625 [Candidatus Binatia bacterium]|nr:hypothetical protein [Candidatus Binatia bacterium]
MRLKQLATFLVAATALVGAAGSSAHAQPPGIKAVFIGHSFFRPFADEMPFHATQAGIVGHTQNVVFRGGPNGAPEALWNDPVTRALIQGYLDAGDVELFGMTAHTDYPTLTGFINWFDYALAQNPNTRFMLALPWLPYPASYTSADYDSAWHATHTGPWHQDLVDALRALYPGVEIFCNPYGQSGPELRLLFDAGNLPGITAVQGPATTSLHTDNLGHAGDILKDLGELVWLNRIYDIDLLTYGYSPPWATDLNAIAQAIMDAHNATYAVTVIRAGTFKLKDDDTLPIEPKKRKLTFRSKKSKNGPSGVVEPDFGSVGDPTSAGSSGGGATLTVYKVGGTPDDVYTHDLPAALWSQTGNAALPGYKYKDSQAIEGPIKKVVLGKGSLVVSGKGDGIYPLADAPQKEMAVRLKLGTGIELCASAPARAPAIKNDTTRKFLGEKDPPLPAVCPPVPEDPGYGSASKAFVVKSRGLL